MKKNILFYMIVLLPWLIACEERAEPEPITGIPEFYLRGDLDGEAFNYEAGENELVAEASSYIKYDNLWFNARLTDHQNFDFEIAIKNVNSGFIDIESSLEPGFIKEFKDSLVSFYRVSFSSSEIVAGASYEWDFGDGNTSSERDPVHDYVFKDSEYTVCLTTTSPDGCRNTLCQTIQPHLNGELNIDAQKNANGIWILSPQVSGFEAISFQWILNGTTVANTKELALQTGAGSEVWDICLKAKSRQNREFERCIQINPANNPDLCTSNFDLTTTTVNDTILIESEERVYAFGLALGSESFSVAESENNSFEILNSQPYENDPNGNPTRKIEFKAILKLVGKDGNLHTLRIEEGALAVGIK